MSNKKTQELGGWQDGLLQSSHNKRRGFRPQQTDELRGVSRGNVRILWFGYLSVVAIIVARLVYLQIFERGFHNLVSAANHLEKIRETAPRGIIFDRNQVPLVRNVPGSAGYTREYLEGPITAPLTGYIAEVTEEEVGCDEGICRDPGMWTGRTGVEKLFETTLRGRDGGRLVELNAQGQMVRELGTNQSEPGQDIHLSVDLRLQRIMQAAILGRRGSAVAIDLQGKILGLVSNPTYDPNLFTVRPDAPSLARELGDEQAQYFLNRAVGGVYPPGSIFKLITAYAGLETGAIDQTTLIEDTGEIRINKYRYGNWFFDQYGQKEGEINVERALARSNDVFFYKVGEMVGVDSLVSWSRKFGLGTSTGVELPGESKGLVPDRLWKERATGEKWFLGNTYHLSIGQGDLQVTPIQMARMTAAAVSGRLCRLSLQKDAPVDCEGLGLQTKNIAIVQEGMKQVCAPGGTAFPFFTFEPWVMCKTGTAQHAGQNPSAGSGPAADEVKPHAWIVVAYPGDNPEMVLVVMLDSAGEGSYEAGPVAKQILEHWRDLGV